MLAGDLYVAADPELVAMRLRARRLTRLYNGTTEEEEAPAQRDSCASCSAEWAPR